MLGERLELLIEHHRAERPDVLAARMAERGDEQICPHLAAGDLHQELAKIDLQPQRTPGELV
jgi:hypothetical protein